MGRAALDKEARLPSEPGVLFHRLDPDLSGAGRNEVEFLRRVAAQ
jgi:hypothetical protein